MQGIAINENLNQNLDLHTTSQNDSTDTIMHTNLAKHPAEHCIFNRNNKKRKLKLRNEN